MTDPKLDQFIRKAMTDQGLRAQLSKDPKGTLAQHGIKVPANLTIRVAEDTANTVWIHLPRVPQGELSVEELDSVAGGFHHADFSGQWGTGTVNRIQKPEGGTTL